MPRSIQCAPGESCGETINISYAQRSRFQPDIQYVCNRVRRPESETVHGCGENKERNWGCGFTHQHLFEGSRFLRIYEWFMQGRGRLLRNGRAGTGVAVGPWHGDGNRLARGSGVHQEAQHAHSKYGKWPIRILRDRGCSVSAGKIKKTICAGPISTIVGNLQGLSRHHDRRV